MKSFEKISETSWKQYLKDRKSYKSWSIPPEVKNYCNFIDKREGGEKRYLQIKFAEELKLPTVIDFFGISSGKEVYFHIDLQNRLKSLSDKQKQNGFFIVSVLDMPTDDITKLENIVETLLKIPNLDRPNGVIKPTKILQSVDRFERDPKVVAWVIQNARGDCECCNSKGFIKEDGGIYLEVHHLRPLSDDGSDTVTNAVAVCANCHRQLHFAANKTELRKQLIIDIQRLVDEYEQ